MAIAVIVNYRNNLWYFPSLRYIFAATISLTWYKETEFDR